MSIEEDAELGRLIREAIVEGDIFLQHVQRQGRPDLYVAYLQTGTPDVFKKRYFSEESLLAALRSAKEDTT